MRNAVIYPNHAVRIAAATMLAGSLGACAAQPKDGQLERLRAAEDARPTSVAGLAPIFGALRPDSDTALLKVAIRAVGRLQQSAFVDSLAPFLRHDDHRMRSEAANAIAQSVQPGSDTVAVAKARELLIARLTATGPDEGRGVVARSLGRLPHESPVISQQVAERIAESVSQAAITVSVCPRDATLVLGAHADSLSPALLFGTMHGIYSVARRARLLGCEATTLARTALGYRATAAGDTVAWVRELAMLSLQAANQADTSVLQLALGDADPRVRRLGLRFTRDTPVALAVRLATQGLSDTAAMVRIDAVRALTLVRPTQGCDLARRALADSNPHVGTESIDAVAAACDAASATRMLDSLVRRLPADTVDGSGSWHAPARALVPLARLAQATAAPYVPGFQTHPVWQVRAAAAGAARASGNTDILLELLRDPDANVREATITLMAQLAPAMRERAVRTGLDAQEYQVVLAAAQAAKEVPTIDARVLAAPLARLTARRQETSRDPRHELIDRIAER
ncbi:MAG: HEAT repeat domain-containing protein, partial [Gemmatimonadaceae bacterium]